MGRGRRMGKLATINPTHMRRCQHEAGHQEGWNSVSLPRLHSAERGVGSWAGPRTLGDSDCTTPMMDQQTRVLTQKGLGVQVWNTADTLPD